MRIDTNGLTVDTVATDGASLPADADFFVGLSGFGFGGTNAHVVLKSIAELSCSDTTKGVAPAAHVSASPTLSRAPTMASELNGLSSADELARPDDKTTRPLLAALLSAHSHDSLLANARVIARMLRCGVLSIGFNSTRSPHRAAAPMRANVPTATPQRSPHLPPTCVFTQAQSRPSLNTRILSAGPRLSDR